VRQSPYNSTISQYVEYLPVAVNIIAAKGCDMVVFELEEQSQEAGIINPPKAASTMYRKH
jgi:hypothetical protein